MRAIAAALGGTGTKKGGGMFSLVPSSRARAHA